MVRFTLIFILGIAASEFFAFFPLSLSIWLAGTVCVLVRKYRGNRHETVIFIIIFMAAFMYSSLRNDALPEYVIPDSDAIIAGTVADVPESYDEKVRFDIDKVYINGKRISGKVRLYLQQRFFEQKIRGLLFYEDRIAAVARIHEPAVFRNSGVYAYDLRNEGVAATGYVKRLKVMERGDGPLAWIYRKRQTLGMLMDRSFSAENASLHKALIPGLKRSISPEMREAFSDTGLSHLLSISGTHFGLLAFMVFNVIRMIFAYLPVKLLRRMTLFITPSQISVIFTLPVLFMYAFISGSGDPTVRSLIMVVIYMIAVFAGRKGQWLNSLAIAAFIILIWQPSSLFSLSFMLSFLAVLSIGCVMENRRNVDDSKSHITNDSFNPAVSPPVRAGISVFEKAKTVILVTAAAVAGTAPLVALYFGNFSFVSLPANLIAAPLICFIVLPLGFFTGFAALILDMPLMPLNGVTGLLTHYSLKLVWLLSSVPFSGIHVHKPSLAMIMLYYVSLFFILKPSCLRTCYPPVSTLDRRGIKRGARYMPFVMIMCFYLFYPCFADDTFRITFLDVGQGGSSVVRLPDRKVMLIDCGPLYAGRGAVAQFLRAKGINRIDYIVMSHAHPDHFGGLAYVINNFDIGEAWINGRGIPEDKGFSGIRKDRTPVRILRRGDVIYTDKYRIHVLHPYDEFHADSPRGDFSDQNNASLVLKIESENGSVLFTGDIEEEAEEDLVKLGKLLESDVLKVPHHGGRTSSTETFISMVQPQIAVISSGRNNIFDHPHEESLRRYRSAGADIYRTDTAGSVTITLKDGYCRVTTYEDTRFSNARTPRDEARNLRLLF